MKEKKKLKNAIFCTIKNRLPIDVSIGKENYWEIVTDIFTDWVRDSRLLKLYLE